MLETHNVQNFAIKCAHTKIVNPGELKEHPLNPNDHSDEQTRKFVDILKYQGWRRPITVSTLSGYITKGHGALKAALSAGVTEVPVDFQDYDTEAQELADIVADNQLARLSTMNMGKLKSIAVEIKAFDVDLSLTGFKLETLETLITASPKQIELAKASAEDKEHLASEWEEKIDRIAGVSSSSSESEESEEIEESNEEKKENIYTKKIDAPVYEPKGAKPAISDLVGTEKTAALLDEIEARDIPEDIKEFLRIAAYRHLVFNFEAIAEYYAHADVETQELMENSALVIIDFKKAIENGFVVLTKELEDLYGTEKS